MSGWLRDRNVAEAEIWSKALLDAIQARTPSLVRRRTIRERVRQIRWRVGMWIIPEDLRCYYD